MSITVLLKVSLLFFVISVSALSHSVPFRSKPRLDVRPVQLGTKRVVIFPMTSFLA